MRILILSSEFLPRRGGIGTYAYEMAQAAAGLGHEVVMVAADYGADQTEDDRARPYRVIRYPGHDHRMKDLPAKVKLVRAIASREERFDIVHAVDWPFFIPVALSPFRKTSRCFLTFHGTEVAYMRKPKRAFILRLLRFWSGWADYIANSRFTGALLGNTFDLPAHMVRSIGLGVSENWLSSRIDRNDARKTLGIGDGTFVITSLGRVVPRKGHLVLAQALALLPPEVLNVISWQIIGPLLDPTYEAALRDAVSRLSCETIIAGKRDDGEVRTRLSAADLFCLPGYYTDDGAVEGFGLVYLEAGALGVTSVATNVGGVPDAIEDGETGILVPPNDSSAIAAAILKLYRDPDERQRLADGALRRAEHSSWSGIVRETYQI